MGPYPPVRPLPEPGLPDISPLRLSAVDVASLTDVEVRAALLKLDGHADPAVQLAVVDVTREVLERTRGQ